MNGTECRPQAPVAEGGTDGTGSPGFGGVRAASGRLKSDVKLINAFVLGSCPWNSVYHQKSVSSLEKKESSRTPFQRLGQGS